MLHENVYSCEFCSEMISHDEDVVYGFEIMQKSQNVLILKGICYALKMSQQNGMCILSEMISQMNADGLLSMD